MNHPAQVVFPPGQGRGPTNAYQPFPIEAIDQSVPARFAQQVHQHAQKIAIETIAGQLTYAELDEASNRLAAAIVHARGEGSEPIAMCLSHGIPQIVGILGILKAGKIYVPLDPTYPVARNAAILRHALPALIVADNSTLALANQMAAGCPVVNLDDLSAKDDDFVPIDIHPDQPAVIIYTSGSTGKPNGLVHSHRNLLHFTLKQTNNHHFCERDRSVLLYSCAFIGSIADLFPCLLNGGTIVPYDLKQQGIANLAQWMAERRITLYSSVPTLFRRFIATLSGAEQFPALRAIRLGGEPVTPRDVELFRQHFGDSAYFSVSLAATEILGITVLYVDSNATITGARLPVGYTLQDTEIEILNEQGQPADPGQPGEIRAHSPYLTLGYWREHQRTESSFLPDPNRPGWRMYRSGDLGLRHADGCIEYLGRKDWQVKVRGHRVEVAEVEAALLDLTGVKEAVVVGQEALSGDHRLIGYVVLEEGSSQTASSLRAALQEQLPEYLIPAAFVLLDTLPTTPTGKVDRQSLPLPTTERPELPSQYVAPRDPLQVGLCEIWRDCLNLSPIGIHDDFFELGGDSVLAIDMALRVEQMFGRAVRQEQLLASRTVEQLALALMLPEIQGDLPPLTELQAGSSKAPLFYFHGDFNGGGLYCVPLARQLGDAFRVIAVHPHGVGSALVPPTIEEMAESRLPLIRKIQPTGPYRFAGHCNGGLVAFEIAHRLARAGETVDFLAMLAPPPDVQWPSNSASVFASAGPAGPIDLAGLSADDRARTVLKAYMDACKLYVVRTFPGSIVLMLPQGNLARYVSMDRWRKIATNVIPLAVPGAHVSMLAPRYLGKLATALRNHLSTATPNQFAVA